jgi:hypothetical protein
MKPLCMDDAEYALWVEGNQRLRVAYQAVRPCSDCPLSFYGEMRAEGRCDGDPWMREPRAVPVRQRLPRCEAWMALAEEHCARALEHRGPHRSASACENRRSNARVALGGTKAARYWKRHGERLRAEARERYAARVGEVRVGFGRPRRVAA